MVFRDQSDHLGPWRLLKRASTLQAETSKVSFHAMEAVKTTRKINLQTILCFPINSNNGKLCLTISDLQQDVTLGHLSNLEA